MLHVRRGATLPVLIGLLSAALIYLLLAKEIPFARDFSLQANPWGFLTLFGALAYLDGYLLYLLCRPPRVCGLRQQVDSSQSD
jgi:uncharacterized integral membrane protein